MILVKYLDYVIVFVDLLLPEVCGLLADQLFGFVAPVLDQLIVGQSDLAALSNEIGHSLLALVHQIVDL